jgi:hypothetical protein
MPLIHHALMMTMMMTTMTKRDETAAPARGRSILNRLRGEPAAPMALARVHA